MVRRVRHAALQVRSGVRILHEVFFGMGLFSACLVCVRAFGDAGDKHRLCNSTASHPPFPRINNN